MTNCCSQGSCSSTKNCPECGNTSKTVGFKTVLHHLKFPHVLGAEESEYYFCSDAACSLVYFSANNKRITQRQISVFDENRAEKICYCFDIDKAVYIEALGNNSAEKIKQFVVQKTKASLCACAIKNPSGRCCLADFKKIESIEG